MSDRSKASLAEIQNKLGYQFKDVARLERGLTHASVRAQSKRRSSKGREIRYDNERLEFLGDRVLGLVVAELLWQADAEANEGDLARRYNYLVCRNSCAAVARAIDIGPHLILSASEEESGGRNKQTILGDAMEGLLGAIFVDGGFDAARKVVLEKWADLIKKMPVVAVDPKSELQEWSQGRGLPLPRYKEISRSGPDHKPVFTAQVEIRDLAPAIGTGPNKRAAQQAAAEAMLQREGVKPIKRNDQKE